ncbi:hypothetical protein IQ269_19280 [Tychonema sp. LEGE 07199]|uniref:hypothetical protein n=1 Tax=unclassified Tychonema TaxID=2642144 RepID=UPI00187FFDCD|nr:MULTISPECIES: hypothetical protein [unclassified Tychonema]MBE9122881.1 hypothetical protein [Tychonema sp. LEGE 07199]MBE9134736.1 hypothetical protein [Tychonema sp. LEGE 07196]
MPPITDEMKSEIAEIDFNAANLILKFQGNYRALSELAETLADSLDSCEMNLQCIQIVSDGDSEGPARAIGLTDLPVTQKRIIVSTALASTVAIKILSSLLERDFDRVATEVRLVGESEYGHLDAESIDEILEQLTEQVNESPDKKSFEVEL